MKRTLLIVLAAVAVLFSSCRPEDLELLKHPIHIQGSVTPTYGVPIGNAEVTLNELLDMLSASNDQIGDLIDPESDIIVLNYSAQMADTINAVSGKGRKGPAPKASDDLSIDTVLTYPMDITFFDEASDILDAGLAIDHLWLTLSLDYYGICEPSSAQQLEQYVTAVFDSLTITYVDHNEIQHEFTNFAFTPQYINNILEHHLVTFDSVDMAEIINAMPRRVTASIRFRFNIDPAFVFSDPNMMNGNFQSTLANMQMTRLVYDANMNVSLPFNIKIGELPYEFDIALTSEDGTPFDVDEYLDKLPEGVDADLNDSYINLYFDNSIPLNFILGAALVNETGETLADLIGNDTVAAAQLTPNPVDPTFFEAAGPTTSLVRAKLNMEKIRKLKQAKSIRLRLRLNTGDKFISIRRSDSMKIRITLQVSPEASVDIPVTHSSIASHIPFSF